MKYRNIYLQTNMFLHTADRNINKNNNNNTNNNLIPQETHLFQTEHVANKSYKTSLSETIHIPFLIDEYVLIQAKMRRASIV